MNERSILIVLNISLWWLLSFEQIDIMSDEISLSKKIWVWLFLLKGLHSQNFNLSTSLSGFSFSCWNFSCSTFLVNK